MNLPENNRQVFIVRIWREPREIEGALPEWRGVIESNQDNQRRYLKSLDEIIEFIFPYLQKMGVRLEIEGRFTQRPGTQNARLSRPE